MPQVDRAHCRRAARECIELARATTDPDTKQLLLIRGQEWLKLAYSDHDTEFVTLLAEFNARQMAGGRPQRQQVQQQQQKSLGRGKRR